jgi:serine protease Do
MRTTLITLALLLTANAAFAYDKKALIESYFSIVMIRGFNETGGLAYGSGVVVDKDKVITNCHVLRTTKQPWISRGEDSYEIKTVKADTWHDLCLVSTNGLPIKPVKIGNSTSLKRGQQVAGIGHSSGAPAPLTSQGEVNGLYAGNPGNVIRTNAKFLMGASGSGLFDLEGYLVGINTFKTAGRGGSIHFALPVEWIKTLETLPEITTFPISGKALWEEDEDKKPFYMQAAVPESRQDWPTLAEVAKRWTKAEPLSADAWFSLALSQENLDQLDLANDNYHHSLTLDTENIDAWMKVGDLAKKRGDDTELNRVYTALNKIDIEIGKQYKEINECTKDC